MKTKIAVLLSLVALCLPVRAVNCVGDMLDIFGTSSGDRVRFIPGAPAVAIGNQTVMNWPRSVAITNGQFAISNLVGGYYDAEFQPGGTTIRVLAQVGDTNTYTFNQLAQNAANALMFATNTLFQYAGTGYVNQVVAPLARSNDVALWIYTSATAGTSYVNQAVAPLASTGMVNSAVAPLASTGLVSAAIAPLASTGYVAAATAPLAPYSYVDPKLAPLASTGFVNNAIQPLVTRTYVDDAIAAFSGSSPTGGVTAALATNIAQAAASAATAHLGDTNREQTWSEAQYFAGDYNRVSGKFLDFHRPNISTDSGVRFVRDDDTNAAHNFEIGMDSAVGGYYLAFYDSILNSDIFRIGVDPPWSALTSIGPDGLVRGKQLSIHDFPGVGISNSLEILSMTNGVTVNSRAPYADAYAIQRDAGGFGHWFDFNQGDGQKDWRVGMDLNSYHLAFYFANFAPASPQTPGLKVLDLYNNAATFNVPIYGNEINASNGTVRNAKIEFNAKADGSSDDSAAINSAITQVMAVTPTNGVLYLPAGRYKITSPIVVPPNVWPNNPVVSQNAGVTIRGAGMGKTIIDATGIGNAGAICLTNISGGGYDGFSVEDLTLQGPQNPAIASIGVAIGRAGGSFAGQLLAIRRCAIIGFGTGASATNIWGLVVDGCNISSNTFYGLCFADTHSSTVKECFMEGAYLPNGGVGGTGIGYIGPLPGVGDNAVISDCTISGFTNAIVNNELNLTVIGSHLENNNLYYATTVSNVGYASLNWIGGYILDGASLQPYQTSPAFISVPRVQAAKVAIINPIFDNAPGGRAWINVYDDGLGYGLRWPYLVTSSYYPVSSDTTNKLTIYPDNIPQPAQSGTLANKENWEYATWPRWHSYNGWSGVRIITSTNDLWIESLGRYSVYGFTNKAHQIAVLNRDWTTNGIVTLPMTTESFKWVWAPCGIKIPAGTTNYIFSDYGGSTDDWYAGDAAPLFWDNEITNVYSAYGLGSGSLNSTNFMYGPVNYIRKKGSGTFNATSALSSPQDVFSAPNSFSLASGASVYLTMVGIDQSGGQGADSVCPRGLVVSNLWVNLNPVMSAGTNVTITLRVNAVDSALTITVPPGAATASNLTSSVTVAQGALLDWRMTQNSASAVTVHPKLSWTQTH